MKINIKNHQKILNSIIQNFSSLTLLHIISLIINILQQPQKQKYLITLKQKNYGNP